LINGKPIPCDEIDFVVTSDSRLLIGRKHTTLVDNSDVLAVGSIYFRNGQIRKITNLSGHYRPTVEEGQRFPQILERLGFDTSGALFQLSESGLVRVNTRLL